jgi:hypothetical protein
MEVFMKEERTITPFGRVPAGKLWWSAIFGGTFFALGIAIILSLFGLAIGAGAAGARGVTEGVKVWSGIWSLVTMFVGFFAGGWLAARASGSQAKSDGRLHGIVVWALGTVSLMYMLLSTTQVAVLRGLNLPTGSLQGMTATAATWLLIATICGLIGGVLGGHAGGYREITTTADIRRAA